MNPFKIVISFIIIIYLFFFISNIFFPAAFPKEEIINKITEQIENSKTKLGEYNSKYNIKFQKKVSLTKNDFETKNTKIEFQCNSYRHCCSENEECSEKIEWTKNTVKFNETANPITSTRCEEIKGTFFCKIYLGKIPAQIKLNDFSINNNFNFNSDKLKITAKIINAGAVTENFAVMQTKIFIVFYENGEKKEELIKEVSGKTTKIEPNEIKILTEEIEINSSGEYLIKTKITGLDFGLTEKKSTINVFGDTEYNCRINKTKKEIFIYPETIGENKIPECEIKYFCSNCLYAFECKYAWKQETSEKNFELGTKDYSTEETRGTNCS